MEPRIVYDQIIFKASHNSYDRDESIAEQLTFHPSSPHNGGCMALEFDIWRHSSPFIRDQRISDNYFMVSHTGTGGSTLANYLRQIKSWHHRTPNHPVILITIDIKSKEGGYSNFHDEIDTYLKCHFDQNLIFSPNRLIKDHSLSLCENVISKWLAIVLF
ncbi:MAG: hypothetical protein IPL49_21140 [Saprospirales bacterium]|nr:hypothetical protein [Saprospirales bacterium]